MEISAIRSAFPFAFPGLEKESAEAAPQALGDRIDINAPALLSDEEVDGVLADTMGMIAGDGAAALSVHGGLSENRVFALLGL